MVPWLKLDGDGQAWSWRIALVECRLQADVCDLDDDSYVATVFNRDGTCARSRFSERDFHDGLQWLETALGVGISAR